MPGAVENDALGALRTSLSSEREWRNIQNTIVTAMRLVVSVLDAQTQQIEAAMSRLEQREMPRTQERDQLHATVISETKTYIAASNNLLTEQIFSQIDARSAAHALKMEQLWESRCLDCQKNEELQWQETERRMRDRVMDDVERILKKHIERQPRNDTKLLEPMERQLKKLEKNMRAMESDFMTQWSSWQHELTATLQSKASLADVASIIETTVDTKIASTQTDSATKMELEHTASLVCELQKSHQTAADDMERAQQQLMKLQSSATETVQMQSHLHELLSIVEKMEGEQSTLKKALATRRMQHQADDSSPSRPRDGAEDTKQAVLRLHDAVKSVRRSVETVAKRAEMEALSEQVAVIRRQLRSEIYQARYIWKDGRPTPKQTIPWSSQAMNSNADVFVWQRSHADAVTTMVPGLYHLQAAFFTRFSPTLQVFVNGEPALIVTGAQETKHGLREQEEQETANTESEWAVQRRRRRLHHSAGDLVGVEIVAFLALPARAVVAIGYDIDERAQGFLNLRKL